MRLRVPLGTSDFLQLREDRLHYVDKSFFVANLLQDPARVLLLPRPRRFGKTLNFSTVRYFVERPLGLRGEVNNVRRAFSGLAIQKAGKEVWSHFQRHPVIFLTFKDVKGMPWSDGRALADVVATEAIRLASVIKPILTPEDRKAWRLVTAREPDPSIKEQALGHLSRWLHTATGEKVFILIDEYDTPIHDAFGDEKQYNQVVKFFRNFFSAGLKDNPYLERGVLTGILRVARESMFSGLKNLQVYSLLREPYSTSFGFTEEDVAKLSKTFRLTPKQHGELRHWYNGYRFGGHVIYNPWSVLSYLRHLGERARPYWVNTGGDTLIRKLFTEADLEIESELETLLSGGTVEKPIDEHTVFRDLERKGEAVFSFLVMSGYLRADELVGEDEAGREHWKLSIPNKEVSTVYRGIFLDWLHESLGGKPRLLALRRALLAGDVSAVEEHLGTILERTLSYHDTAGRAREVVYQAFVAGLLVALEKTHYVRSNRESGSGRCDVLIVPRKAGQPGVALELKNRKPSETAKRALSAALRQVRERRYAAELRAAGASPIIEMAAVFDKKTVRVACG